MKKMMFILILAVAIFFGCDKKKDFNRSMDNTARDKDYWASVPIEDPAVPYEAAHGISLVGPLKYQADFQHFDYVNPGAPKGGELVLANIGKFDSFNPFILKGTGAPGSTLIFETLLDPSMDESSSSYGLLAEKLQVAKDNASVRFFLRKQARFHDGTVLKPEDVVFSFNQLVQNGHPFYASYYAEVEKAEVAEDNSVVFSFSNPENKELPSILGQMYVFPQAFWKNREFASPLSEVPLGSGPYTVESFEMGKYVLYKRNENYWAADLPIGRGRYNYDKIRYITYLDNTVAFQEFKSGGYDFRLENTASRWASEYTGTLFDEGRIIKQELPDRNPQGFQGFVFNLRKPIFADIEVRKAIGLVFDFEWTNKVIFHNAYIRTKSYFENSVFASHFFGLPSEQELKYLNPLKDQLPPDLFSKVWQPPLTDGSGRNRSQIRRASEILDKAGWLLKEGVRVHQKSGEKLQFEIILVSPAFERVVAPFQKNLEKLGVAVKYRTIDPAQYQKKINEFDFDMIVGSIGQSNSPGNEQRNFWGSEAADIQGSRNWAGIKNPAVDFLIDKIVKAQSREELVYATRALDRVLLWNFYMIPHWYIDKFRVAYKSKIKHPKVLPGYNIGVIDHWWIEEE